MKHNLLIEVSLKIVLVVPWGCSSASDSGCIFTAGKQGWWGQGGWVCIPVGSLVGASRGFWAFTDKICMGLWQYCSKICGKLEQAQKNSSSSFQCVCVLGSSHIRSCWPLLVTFTCFKTRKFQLNIDQSLHTSFETELISYNPGFCFTSSFMLLKTVPWFPLCKIMTHWNVCITRN